MYNAIIYSLYEGHPSKNSNGYASAPSNSKSIKVWSLASDWETLLTGKPSTEQFVLGLVAHRMGGNKQLITIMNKLNHSISYPTVQKQNKVWSKKATTKYSMFSSMRKGIVTHSTMDNNDGMQESVTGAGTTHDTNQTLFQLPTTFEVKSRRRNPYGYW